MERGGDRVRVCGGSIPSAAAFLAYACQSVERASVLNYVLSAFAVQFSWIERRCFQGIPTIGGGSFVGYMPAGRQGKRTAPFSFFVSTVEFSRSGASRLKGLRWIATLGGGVFGTCMPECCVLNYVLSACAIQFSWIGGRCIQGIPTVGGGSFVGYMPAGRQGKRTAPFSFFDSTVEFLRSGVSRLKGLRWIAILGGGTFGVGMPACKEGERTELCFLCLRRSIVQNRGRRFGRISTIGCGAFDGYMPVGRENIFFCAPTVEL